MPYFCLIVLITFLPGCVTSKSNRLLYYKVKVRHGESVAQIAQKFDTTWQRILSDNNLRSPEQIKPAMILKVKPGPGGYLAGTEAMSRSLKTAAKSALVWPLQGTITSRYGMRWFRRHEGIDIDGETGDKVVAAASGKVTFAGWRRGYGKVVIIRHAEGSTRYAHLHRMGVVLAQSVRQGQTIGEVGSTGNASGSHLHFEVRTDLNNAIDPLDVLPADVLLSGR